MTDELCRKCGGSMMDKLFCEECKEATQRICTKCESKTDERIHFHGLYQKASLGLLIVGHEIYDWFPTLSVA